MSESRRPDPPDILAKHPDPPRFELFELSPPSGPPTWICATALKPLDALRVAALLVRMLGPAWAEVVSVSGLVLDGKIYSFADLMAQDKIRDTMIRKLLSSLATLDPDDAVELAIELIADHVWVQIGGSWQYVQVRQGESRAEVLNAYIPDVWVLLAVLHRIVRFNFFPTTAGAGTNRPTPATGPAGPTSRPRTGPDGSQ